MLCIWPDQDNTFMAYNYENGVPSINDPFLNSLGKAIYDKAKKLFDVVLLDHIAITPKDKDKRSKNRLEVYRIAQEMYSDWLEMRDTKYKSISIRDIKKIAICSGFFSTWMTVFKHENEIKIALIDAYLGTAKHCFDINGDPIRRNTDTI